MMLFFICFYLIFLYFNIFTPFYPGDDYVYSYIWEIPNLYTPIAENAVKISSFSDLFLSLLNHHMMWCGRLTNHFFVMFFAWKGRMLFNIFNAFVSVLLIYLIVLMGNKGKFNKKYFIFTFVCLWIFQLGWNGVFLWLAGSCNYVWSSTLVLLFLYLFLLDYYKIYDIKNKLIFYFGKFSYLFLFCFSFFVGCTNENSIFAVLFCLGIYLFYLFRKKIIYSWQITAYIGLFLGYLFMVSSPSNYSRIFYEVEEACLRKPNLIYIYEPILNHLRNGATWFSSLSKDLILYNFNTLISFVFSQIFLWGILGLYFVEKIRFKLKKKPLFHECNFSKEDKNLLLFFMLLAFLSEFILMVSPTLPHRAGFFGLVFLVIDCIILLRCGFLDSLFKNKMVYLIKQFLVFIFIMSFISSCFLFPLSYRNRLNWIDSIKKQDSVDINDTIIVPYCDDDEIMSKLFFLSLYKNSYFVIFKDENSWVNISFKKYHNLNSKVKVKLKQYF